MMSPVEDGSVQRTFPTRKPGQKANIPQCSTNDSVNPNFTPHFWTHKGKQKQEKA